MRTLIQFVFATAIAIAMLASPAAAQDAQTKKVLASIKKEIQSNSVLTPAVKKLASTVLISLTTDKVVIAETEKLNGKKVALSEIQRIDKAWKAAEEEIPEMKDRLNNKTAAVLKKFAAKNNKVVEIFVMDNQGAVVGENNMTSDYWQGDEAKWQNSYKGGKGGVDAGKVEFDKSANANLQQVSLPVIAKGGKIIGAITFGVKAD